MVFRVELRAWNLDENDGDISTIVYKRSVCLSYLSKLRHAIISPIIHESMSLDIPCTFANTISSRMFHITDWYPTIMEMAGSCPSCKLILLYRYWRTKVISGNLRHCGEIKSPTQWSRNDTLPGVDQTIREQSNVTFTSSFWTNVVLVRTYASVKKS